MAPSRSQFNLLQYKTFETSREIRGTSVGLLLSAISYQLKLLADRC